MKTKGKGVSLSQLWKRNAVVAAIALFVCAAVYLNWNYEIDVLYQQRYSHYNEVVDDN